MRMNINLLNIYCQLKHFFQLKTMKEALASNQESKHILEMNLQKLNHQLESKGMDDLKTKQKVDNLAAELRHKQEKESKLKGEVQRREEKLKKAKRYIFSLHFTRIFYLKHLYLASLNFTAH